MPEEDFDKGEDIEFSPKAATFKEIIMQHIKKITTLYCFELRGGYYTTQPTKHGEEKEVYVEDRREALENAIYCLAQLLISKFDSKMEKRFKEFKGSIKSAKDGFIKKSSLDETAVLGESFYDKVKDKILLEQYKINKLELHKELFTELSLLLARKKFLEIGGAVF